MTYVIAILSIAAIVAVGILAFRIHDYYATRDLIFLSNAQLAEQMQIAYEAGDFNTKYAREMMRRVEAGHLVKTQDSTRPQQSAAPTPPARA